VPVAERESINKAIEQAKFSQGEKFDQKYNDIINIQERAMAPLRDTVISDEQRSKQLMENSLPEWEQAQRLAEELKSFADISPSQKKKTEVITAYIRGRQNEIKIINSITESNARALKNIDFSKQRKEMDVPQSNIDLTKQRKELDSLVNILNTQ